MSYTARVPYAPPEVFPTIQEAATHAEKVCEESAAGLDEKEARMGGLKWAVTDDSNGNVVASGLCFAPGLSAKDFPTPHI